MLFAWYKSVRCLAYTDKKTIFTEIRANTRGKNDLA